MKSIAVDVDVLVLGGGVAALWLLHRLRTSGYRAILLNEGTLGGEQTLASQGMIHGGIKYGLDGAWEATNNLAGMPALWSACLAGNGEVDLRAARVVATDTLLWSCGDVVARIGSVVASRLVQGQVTALAASEFPPPFDHGAFAGRVYRVADPVVDVPSLVETLAAPQHEAIFQIDWQHAEFRRGSAGEVLGVTMHTAAATIELRAERTVVCAGGGNRALLARLATRVPATQTRPLHQVLLKHAVLPPLYGHCIGLGTHPRLTISSHRHADGEWIWHVGGELAESGAAREPQAQIAHAAAELAGVFPMLNLRDAAWRSYRIDRAEAQQHGNVRPADVEVCAIAGASGVLAAWPGKLTWAPRLANQVLDALRDVRATAEAGDRSRATLANLLARPALGITPWQRLFA